MLTICNIDLRHIVVNKVLKLEFINPYVLYTEFNDLTDNMSVQNLYCHYIFNIFSEVKKFTTNFLISYIDMSMFKSTFHCTVKR